MIFSYLLTLFGVCGLAVGTLVVLRAVKGGGLALAGVQPIRVVGRQSLGTGSTLMLLEVDGQRMLLGVSRSGITVLEAKSPASAGEAKGTTEGSEVSGSHAVSRRSIGALATPGDTAGSGSFSTILRRAGARW